MVKKKRSKTDYEDSSLVDPTSRSFIYDEVDDYNNIDRDEQYAELNYENTTKVISKNKRKEHVLGLDLDSSEDDDEDKDDDNDESDNDDNDDISFDDDIESSENEDDVPLEDERTMGKRKKDYFGTDITDERMHNVVKMKKKRKKNEEESLQVELDLAQQMQKRIGKEKEAFQFFVDDELEASEEAKQQKPKEGDSSSVKKSGKDKKSKKQLKESGLDPEVQEKCEELSILLSPLIGALKKGLLPPSDATEYLTTRYLLCLNFLNNVAAKKMLERSGDDTSQHPVETRLTQYRQMYKELDNCKAAFEPELHKLLKDLSSGVLRKPKKMLGILQEKKSEKDEKKVESEPIKDKQIEKEDISDEDEMDHDMEDVIKGDVEEVDAQGRRLITYEIEKNKGLMPYRKKELRNPRVKYKKKYQNKLKRRKGQVREVRTETTRYGGELFGIKANTIKSIKLK